MLNLKHASLEIKKAAAMQDIRTGKFRPFHYPNDHPKDSDLIATVENSKKKIQITRGDIQAAT